MKKHPRIAVALPDSKPWGIARFFNGVQEYAREHGWLLASCPVNPATSEDFPADWTRLKSWHVDGIILQSNDLRQSKLLSKLRVPMVNIGENLGTNNLIPRIAQNNQLIGRLAAEHLISLGLKNLAYHGVIGQWYSDERLRGFKQAAKDAHLKVHNFCLPHLIGEAFWNERYELVKRWLKTLPLPVGVFAMRDYRALIVLSACRDAGLSVPEDVAVIGVDNDLMVCEFSTPTLTSVCVNPHRMGLEAAKLLDRLMKGDAPPKEPILIDPTKVAVRASTEVIHIDDLAVKKAVQFMQERFAEAVKMDTVADAVGVSRRSLEMRFRKERNTSPAEFLVNLRIEKAKVMLSAAQHHPIEEIARTCGFVTGKNLRAAFHRLLKAAPNDFRAK